MDISKAFDSVNIPNLIHQLLTADMPIIWATYKFYQMRVKRRNIREKLLPISKIFDRKVRKQTIADSRYPLFPDFVKEEAPSINILHAKNKNYMEDKLSQIEKVLDSNVILFNNQYFKRKRGVPQGLNCSPSLSSIYYKNIEEEVYKKLMEVYSDTPIFLARLVDDYLCMSPNQDAVQLFLELMNSAAEKEGFNFAVGKNFGNFESPLIAS